MDFKKQRPDPPFFFEKEQVIPLLRQRSKTGMKDWVKRSLDEIDSLFPIDRINRSKERWTRVWTGERPLDRYPFHTCLLYTSDAADDLLCVDLGGRRIIKK